MKIFFYLLFFFFPISHSFSLTIHIYGEKNGKGLEKDIFLLTEELSKLGHKVRAFPPRYKKSKKSDINIFLESVYHPLTKTAPRNWFIPNPECYDEKITSLKKIDLILCKTRQTETIFKHLGKKTYFLGFTSKDCLLDIPKDYFHLLHLAGGSEAKGTHAILSMWKEDLPPLTLIKHGTYFPSFSNLLAISHRISEEDLRYLQNSAGLHLCPSEAEGFGHSLMEALSTGGIVITTDAPPMNEFVKDLRCLVPFTNTIPRGLSTSYFVDPIALDRTIRSLLSLSMEELIEIGEKNRLYYLQNKEEFRKRLASLLEQNTKKNIKEFKKNF